MLLNQQQLMQLRNQLLLLLELPQVGTLPLHAASVELDLRRRSSSCRSRSAGLLACSSSSRKEEREAAGREGGGGAGNRKGALEERELPNCVSEERERG